VHDIVGLYLIPPDAAVVMCVDEKSQIPALDRSAPVLALLPGVPERHTHDYVRNGTANHYAAVDVASGEAIADMVPRHRAEEDPPSIHRWLLRHPRLTLHFTPTYGSRLKLVERWFDRHSGD
jgi:hypothetical protein